MIWQNKLRSSLLVTLCFLLCFPVAALPLDTVDDVVARHVEARGGLARWKAITNMKLTGNFTAFSITKPFSLVRTRDGHIRFDAYWGESVVITASNGQQHWWINKMMGKTPTDLPEWGQIVLTDLRDFATPLFDYQEKGYRVELLGQSELDGAPAIAIKLIRGEDNEETWYLDPTTYLEVGRVSQGSDFGSPAEQTTFFDDFRKVNGLTIPFITETTYGTRHRLMEVETMSFDVALDAEIFEKPMPDEMLKLKSLIGEWSVEVSQRNSPKASWQKSETSSIIEAQLDGNLLMENFRLADGQVVRTWSHDQFRETYTVVETSSGDGLSNILQGSWLDGVLQLDNVKSGTFTQDQDRKYHRRYRVIDITADSFTVASDLSRDAGENWFNNSLFAYRRAPKK